MLWLLLTTVLATYADDAARREGIVAQTIALPRERSPADFAASLVEAEKLVPWNRDDAMPETIGPTGIGYRARHAGDGHEVVVYYDARRDGKDHVCRITRPRGGVSDAHYRAVRWCYASFGVLLPEQPASPIAQNR